MGSYVEVGNVPGTYRIIDLYCLKEVLNQIMRCSCDSDAGFAIFQGDSEISLMSFYTKLDILCKNCKRKISFGTSMLRKENDNDDIRKCEADVDILLENLLMNSDYKQKLWNELCRPTASDSQDTIILDSTRFTTLDSAPELADEPLPIQDITAAINDKTILDPVKKSSKSNYQCHFCSKLFSKQYNLVQHIRIHTGETIDCSKCTKKFRDKSTLNKHIKAVHEQMKPFSCVTCGKKFKRRNHLKEHFAVHTGDKKFSCDACSKSFSFKSTLQRHMLIHTEIESIKCTFCGKDFHGLYSYKKHVKKFHQTDIKNLNASGVT